MKIQQIQSGRTIDHSSTHVAEERNVPGTIEHITTEDEEECKNIVDEILESIHRMM